MSSLVRRCVFYRPELTGKWVCHGTKIKILKSKTEIYQRIGIKEYMRKMGSFLSLRLLPESWSLKCQKWLILCTFCWLQQKIRPSLGKIFKRIWMVLFGRLEKHYGLCTLELLLAKFQRLKYRILVFFCWFRTFSDIYPQYLTNR